MEHHRNFHDISFKTPWNLFENPLKLPWNVKRPRNTIEIIIAHLLCNMLERSVNHPWNFIETSLKSLEIDLKHRWNTLKTFFKRCWNTLYTIITPLELPWNTFVTPLRRQWDTLITQSKNAPERTCILAWRLSSTEGCLQY